MCVRERERERERVSERETEREKKREIVRWKDSVMMEIRLMEQEVEIV